MRTTHTLSYALALGALAASLSSSPAAAVVTSTWTTDSYKSFDEGEAHNAFITSLGEVRPGAALSRTAVEVDGVWSAALLPNGAVVLGTDDDGAIYTVTKGKAQKALNLDGAVAVVSLAAASDGRVFAGTMPGGQIWQVDLANKKATKLADLAGVETVWALGLDTAGKTLWAGTGPQGKLFSVEVGSGKSAEVFDSGDKRIIALTVTPDGAVWFGTSDRALVFRHDPGRKATRAMADFAGNEVTALAPLRGGVVVAANEFAEPATTGAKTTAAVNATKKKPREGEKAKMPEVESTPGADAAAPAGTETPRKGARKGKGALFHVRGDGAMDQLHALTATYFASVATNSAGQVFAGAGDKGRVYMVDADDSVSTAFDVEERVVSQLLVSGDDRILFATDDAGAFYEAGGVASDARYESDVFDTKSPARFGRITWHGGGALVLETRSGNTAKPGTGWSAWSKPANPGRAGGNASTGKITSPNGRYLQYRATFGGDAAATLRRVEVYYLPTNRPTRITEVTFDGGSGDLVTNKEGAVKPRSPVIKLKWKVENLDSDETRYTLEVRREGDATWRAIPTGKSSLTATTFEWNTETFPDGHYRLRVTASDDRSNSADRARDHHFTTPLFLIDNEKPRIEGVTVKYPSASARATDAMSQIAEMSYAIDDGEWFIGAPQDGLFDDLSEMLILALPKDLAPGLHTLAIRVADRAGNLGAATTTFRIP